jgi:hypothetical protein
VDNAVHHVHVLTRTHPLPWLVLGKGPTSDRYAGLGDHPYHVLTLNHACRVPGVVALAHFTDWGTFAQCAAELADRRVTACLPWRPHVNYKAGERTLPELAADLPSCPPLVSYNATTSGLPKERGLNTVRLRFFSSVAAFNLLGQAGIRQVASLGVDGGTGYGRAFDASKILANGRRSFDDQEAEIRRACREFKMKWRRL